MIDEACNTILIERNKIKGVPLTLTCNKGEGGSKRDRASFIKLVARDYENEERVIVRSIGRDTTGNTSRDAAAGINSALTLFDLPGNKLKLSNQCTDAGGGGTRLDLFRKLEEVDRVKC